MHVYLSSIEEAGLDLNERIVEAGLQEAGLVAINLVRRLGDVDGNVIGRNADELAIFFVKTHNSVRSSSDATLLHEPK